MLFETVIVLSVRLTLTFLSVIETTVNGETRCKIGFLFSFSWLINFPCFSIPRHRARLRMDQELEEMGHFRMFAMMDDNPRSPKRLLSSIARLRCCAFKTLEGVDEQCLICMDTFGPETIVRQLLCKHVFCEGCVLQWFGHSSCCPKCRGDILTCLE